MAKIIDKKYSDDDLSYVVDFLVGKDEYAPFRDKVLEQIASNIEVKGFRKGKAPVEKALQQADKNMVTTTVIKETVDKFAQEHIEKIQDNLKKDERVLIQFNLDYHPDYTGENEKGDFKFRLIASIFPKIDISKIEKIKIKEPSEKDIKDLPTLTEFVEEETKKILSEANVYEKTDAKAAEGYQLTVTMSGEIDGKKADKLDADEFIVNLGSGLFLPEFEKSIKGLKEGDKKTFDLPFPKNYGAKDLAGKTAKVTVEVKEVKKPKFDNLKDLVENNEQLKKMYKDSTALEEDIKKVFEDKKQSILGNVKKKSIVEETLKAIEDFAVNQNLLKAEVERILGLIKEDSTNKEISVGEAFVLSNLPGSEVKGADKYDEKKIEKALEDYVKNELKLTQILGYIYETKVENKPTAKEFEDYVKAIKQNPEQFQISKESSDEQIASIANDRIIRQMAGAWLIDTITKNSQTK